MPRSRYLEYIDSKLNKGWTEAKVRKELQKKGMSGHEVDILFKLKNHVAVEGKEQESYLTSSLILDTNDTNDTSDTNEEDKTIDAAGAGSDHNATQDVSIELNRDFKGKKAPSGWAKSAAQLKSRRPRRRHKKRVSIDKLLRLILVFGVLILILWLLFARGSTGFGAAWNFMPELNQTMGWVVG